MLRRTTETRTAVPAAVVAGLPASTWRNIILGVGLVVVLVLPFLFKPFYTFQITLAVIYAIAVLGLNLLTGINGQFSLGHSAFYAIGAYTTAIMMEHGGIEYYWTLPVAGLVCFVFGFLFGLPALRLEGIYLALATFALAIAIPQALKSTAAEHWTGGVQGIVLIKPDAPFGLKLNSDQWLYFFTLAIALVMYGCAANLVKSGTGRALIAIRDHPIAASAMGINVALYKALTFGVSALYTGIAGALGALAIAYVAPDSFTFALAIGLFVGLVVGGVGSNLGTIFGGFFVLFVPNISEHLLNYIPRTLEYFLGYVPRMAEHLAKSLPGAVYGLILILVIYVMPTGVAGMVRKAVGYLVRQGR